MEKQRSQAIESLEISNDSVKPKSNRIAVLERRINWLENNPHSNNNIIIKQLKQELADLLEEDAKANKLRSLPLYSCRITGWL
jgi:hypothetical protein